VHHKQQIQTVTPGTKSTANLIVLKEISPGAKFKEEEKEQIRETPLDEVGPGSLWEPSLSTIMPNYKDFTSSISNITRGTDERPLWLQDPKTKDKNKNKVHQTDMEKKVESFLSPKAKRKTVHLVTGGSSIEDS